MNEFGQKGNVSDEDFMIQVLNNLPKEYDVILDGLENHLVATRDDALTINSIHKKSNHRYKKIKNKKEEKIEKKHWMHIVNNTNSSAGNVASMATNLVTEGALKIKMKQKKIIRKQKDMKIKIEN